MEINRFYVEKAKVDGMRLGENKIEENPSEKGIKESISERIMDIGNWIQLCLV